MDFAIGLLALTAMEIVLGIDNIVFITIVSARLPKEQQPKARRIGLILALVTRIMLLFTLSFIVTQLTYSLFSLTDLGIPTQIIDHMSGASGSGHVHSHAETALPPEIIAERFEEANGVSWRDLVLFFGGMFLIAKSVWEIHDEFGEHGEAVEVPATSKAFMYVLAQIAVLDIIFSLDSVITAVGMVDDIRVMVGAILISVIVMLIFAEPVSRFVESNPTLKMLALSFLILIGVMLVAESVGAHIDKGYIYFAMFFALVVEFMNIRLRKRTPKEPQLPAAGTG